MKGLKYLILLQLLLSLASAVLVVRMSWIGRVGINLFYGQYKIFESWSNTASLFFFILLILDAASFFLKKKASKPKVYYRIFIIIGLLGLFITFYDFNTTFTHRLMNEKFHSGFYLFWLTWIGSSVYFMLTRITTTAYSPNQAATKSRRHR